MELSYLSERKKFAIGGIIVWLCFAIYFGICLSGCATTVFDYEWHRVGDPITARFYVTAPHTDATCRSVGTKSAGSIYGCSHRDYKQKVCMIYLPPNPPEWLVKHEEKHCDGYDHA